MLEKSLILKAGLHKRQQKNMLQIILDISVKEMSFGI